MFSKRKNNTLMFINKNERNTPIHMFFVFFPIDIFWLNKNKEVVYVKRNARPFTLINPKVKSKYVIETPVNSNKNIRIKDQLNFDEY